MLCNLALLTSLRGTIGTVKVLAIDTSGAHGGVAFLADSRVLAEESGALHEPSSSGLFRRVRSVLGRASTKLSDVDCFAVAAGPGSFTGLRVGLTAVKGWAEVWQKPIAAVSVLEAVAAQATEPGALLAPLADARRGLLFCGAYRRTTPADSASQDSARPKAFRNSTHRCRQGLDVRNSLPPHAEGEVFFLDIPFYRTRKIRTVSKAAPPAPNFGLL